MHKEHLNIRMKEKNHKEKVRMSIKMRSDSEQFILLLRSLELVLPRWKSLNKWECASAVMLLITKPLY